MIIILFSGYWFYSISFAEFKRQAGLSRALRTVLADTQWRAALNMVLQLIAVKAVIFQEIFLFSCGVSSTMDAL